MSLDTTQKKKIVKEFSTKPNDTGSPEVQIALLTERINCLTDHFKLHKKDNHSRRGLLKMVWRAGRCSTTSRRRTRPATRKIIERLELRR